MKHHLSYCKTCFVVETVKQAYGVIFGGYIGENGALGSNESVGTFRTTALKLINAIEQLLFSTVITTSIWRTPHGGHDIGTLSTVFESRAPPPPHLLTGPTFAHHRSPYQRRRRNGSNQLTNRSILSLSSTPATTRDNTVNFCASSASVQHNCTTGNRTHFLHVLVQSGKGSHKLVLVLIQY